MTAEQFIRWAESYYGEYKPVVKEEVFQWLDERQEFFISGIREMVRDNFSNQYKTPPDVAVLNRFRVQETYDRGRDIYQLAEEKRRQIEVSDKQIQRTGGRMLTNKDLATGEKEDT